MLAGTICYLTTFIPVTLALLQITEVRGPSAVQNGSTSRLVLDCVYTVDKDDLQGLVVKWFYNGNPFPVYQWIPGNKPQDLGILKGRLDLSHTVPGDHWGSHRALAILNPTTELSGKYSCSVSSFFSEDVKTKTLVVYVPASGAELTYRKPSVSSILVTCHAEGLYPEPELFVYKSRPYLERMHRNVISSSEISKQVQQEGNSYNITAKVVLFDFELRGDTVFMCEVSIPGTNYRIHREVYYTPGQPQHQKSVLYGGSTKNSMGFLQSAVFLLGSLWFLNYL